MYKLKWRVILSIIRRLSNILSAVICRGSFVGFAWFFLTNFSIANIVILLPAFCFCFSLPRRVCFCFMLSWRRVTMVTHRPTWQGGLTQANTTLLLCCLNCSNGSRIWCGWYIVWKMLNNSYANCIASMSFYSFYDSRCKFIPRQLVL